MHRRVGEAGRSVTEILRQRLRIVVDEINKFATRGFEGGVALDGGLLAAHDEDFQKFARIIELARGGDGLDLDLAGPGRNDDRDQWERCAHGGFMPAPGVDGHRIFPGDRKSSIGIAPRGRIT